MTMRTKLLLLLLPTMIFFTLGLSFLLAYHWQIEIIIGAIVLLIFILLYIAKKIAKPIEKLKNLALFSAAGHYEAIEVKGPKEVTDLANTINTMSACLKEQITRLQENSLMKERMYGEYECSVLLQHYMLQKVIESYSEDYLAFRSLDLISEQLRGLALTISPDALNTSVTLKEAKEKGFQGIYALIKTKEASSLNLTFHHASHTLSYICHAMPIPFVWNTAENTRAEAFEDTFNLKSKDLVFLYNQGFGKHFSSEVSIHAWFGKVLRHFAKDGLDITTAMLEKELLFFSRKRNIDEDIHIICIQIS
ncbi:MAG: hypothetical protein P4L16_02160 [Chlamydiales bacterium]|nr:hypothetical protein [Chlamydiales bacterium]